MNYSIKLIKSYEVARDTKAFYFKKPETFSYQAGQYIDMTIPDKLDPKDPDSIRSFTLASAPCENELIIATRMRKTSFKQTLATLAPGDTVSVEGPKGEFILPGDTTQPIVMLAGGIGVTPFRSILVQAAYKKRKQDITLFYSNRARQDAPFLEELSMLAKTIPYMLIGVFTQEGDPYINEDLLKKNACTTHAIYYIAGPGAMVGAMQRLLYAMRVSPNHLRLDEFTGY